MALNKLISSGELTNIQQTTFSLDVLARYCCNTWEEIQQLNKIFDYIIVGSGMYGAYCASKLFRLSKSQGSAIPNILVLESGPFLISEHVQNLSRIGYSIFDPCSGKPYVSKIKEPGLSLRDESVADHYYCIGGKSLGWGKWSPRLTEKDLVKWPATVAQYLRENYEILEAETGVWPSADFINGDLHDKLKMKAISVLENNVTDFTYDPDTLPYDLEPPIAIQGHSPASGLFSFDAFSSVVLLIDAIREDIESVGINDAARHLFLVPYSRVYNLGYNSGKITGLDLLSGREGNKLNYTIPPTTKVILACNSIESTRLSLQSLINTDYPGKNLIGGNLMTHLRSNMVARIKKSALAEDLPEKLQAAALHFQGEIENRRFHVQFFAAADPDSNGEAVLYRLLPDLDNLQEVLDAQRSEWITLKVLTVGEMVPSQNTWMNLSPFEFDNLHGITLPKAYLNWDLSVEDDTFWTNMDNNALNLVSLMADRDLGSFEIFNEETGSWQNSIPTNVKQYRDSLGSTFHEAGTLIMGEDPTSSVTDIDGKFHGISNLYCCDQAIFPSVGSANPVLTGLTLTRRIVEALI